MQSLFGSLARPRAGSGHCRARAGPEFWHLGKHRQAEHRPRQPHRHAAQYGDVLAAGGNDNAGTFASAELYSPATGKWTVTGSMATVRSLQTATLLPSGQVLVAGGLIGISATGVASYTGAAELYNPATGQWTVTGSMTTPRAAHAATLLANGQVLVAGGLNSSGSTLASAELYDPSSGTWKATGSMNDARANVQATLLQNGQVLIAGGAGLANGASYTAELYANGHWRLTSSMVFSHPSTTRASLLIFGGHLASYASEFFNPATGLWTATHNIGVNPPNGPLTLLLSGKVLLAAGESSYGTDSIARLYDSPSNAWLTTGNLNQARAGHTATRLANGQVLATGGEFKNSSGTFTILSSAELYTP
jgi:Galactose oxidase, central domain